MIGPEEEFIVREVIIDFDYICMFLIPLALLLGTAATKMLVIIRYGFKKTGGINMEIKEVIVSNFCQDYRELTNNGRWEAVCLVGTSYDSDNVFNENPCVFLVKKEKDFEFQKVQNLIDERINQFWLGVKLGFIDGICLDGEITKHYVISDNRVIKIIRCV